MAKASLGIPARLWNSLRRLIKWNSGRIKEMPSRMILAGLLPCSAPDYPFADFVSLQAVGLIYGSVFNPYPYRLPNRYRPTLRLRMARRYPQVFTNSDEDHPLSALRDMEIHGIQKPG